MSKRDNNKKATYRARIVGVIFTTYVNERWFIERHTRDEAIVKKVSQEVVVDSKREYRKGKRALMALCNKKISLDTWMHFPI